MAGLLQGVNLPPAIAMPAPSQAYLSDPLGGFTKVLGGFLEGRQTDAAARQKAAIEEAAMAGDENTLRALTQAGASNQAGLWDTTKLGEVQKAARGALEGNIINELNLGLKQAELNQDEGAYNKFTSMLEKYKPDLGPQAEQTLGLAGLAALPAIQVGSKSRSILQNYQNIAAEQNKQALNYFKTVVTPDNPYLSMQSGIPMPISRELSDFLPTAQAEVDASNPMLKTTDPARYSALVAQVAQKGLQDFAIKQSEAVSSLSSGLPQQIKSPLQLYQETISAVTKDFMTKGQDPTDIKAKLGAFYDLTNKIDPKVQQEVLDPKLASIDARTKLLHEENDASFKQLQALSKPVLESLYRVTNSNVSTINNALTGVRGGNSFLDWDVESNREEVTKHINDNYINKTVPGLGRAAYPQEVADALTLAKAEDGINIEQFESALKNQMATTDKLVISSGYDPKDLLKDIKNYYTTRAGIDAQGSVSKLKEQARVYADMGIAPANLFTNRDSSRLEKAIANASMDTVNPTTAEPTINNESQTTPTNTTDSGGIANKFIPPPIKTKEVPNTNNSNKLNTDLAEAINVAGASAAQAADVGVPINRFGVAENMKDFDRTQKTINGIKKYIWQGRGKNKGKELTDTQYWNQAIKKYSPKLTTQSMGTNKPMGFTLDLDPKKPKESINLIEKAYKDKHISDLQKTDLLLDFQKTVNKYNQTK